MLRRLIILLLIVGCGTEPEDVYGCIDSNAINYSPNATVSDNTCEYSVYGGYPDFESICGMDEFGNHTENIGDGICGLCLGQIEYEGLIPLQNELSLAYPNPFNNIVTLNMSIQNLTDVEVYVLDTEYNKIATLVSGQIEGGYYSIFWNSIISPIGYYRIVADFGDVECFHNVHYSSGCVNNIVLDECGECGGNGAGEGEVSIWGECYSIIETDSLNLFSSGIGAELIPEVCNLTNLKYLILSRNQLTNIQDCFGDLNGLIRLSLSSNQLTTLPESIGNLSSLKELSLSSNQLTTLPESIGNLNSLMALGIISNQITNLPESIGSLNSLVDLHIDDNQLITLPNSIKNLINLKFFHLSGNQLTTLPDSIGNLNTLKTLKLHNNQLSTLPEDICNLSNLQWSLTNSYAKSTIYNNKLCPPYPECIADYVGAQDTSNCP